MTSAARRPWWRSRRLAVAAGLATAALVALVPVREDAPAAGPVSADFAGTSVHVDPGAQVRLDVERVRAAIGERPLVVGAYPADRGSGRDVCEDVARDLPDVLVVAYAGTGFPALCAGTGFPVPDDPTLQVSALGSATDVWLLRLGRTAELSSSLRVAADQRDRTVEVEELVLAFDVAATEDFDDGLPPRQLLAAAPDDPRTLGDALPLLGALSIALVALALLAQSVATALVDRVAWRRRAQERRVALDAELTRFAHSVLRPREAAGREAAAAAYAEAVLAFEAATTPAGLARAEAALRRAARAASPPV